MYFDACTQELSSNQQSQASSHPNIPHTQRLMHILICLFIYVCMYLRFLHIKGWRINGAKLIRRYLKCMLQGGEGPEDALSS